MINASNARCKHPGKMLPAVAMDKLVKFLRPPGLARRWMVEFPLGDNPFFFIDAFKLRKNHTIVICIIFRIISHVNNRGLDSWFRLFTANCLIEAIIYCKLPALVRLLQRRRPGMFELKNSWPSDCFATGANHGSWLAESVIA